MRNKQVFMLASLLVVGGCSQQSTIPQTLESKYELISTVAGTLSDDEHEAVLIKLRQDREASHRFIQSFRDGMKGK